MSKYGNKKVKIDGRTFDSQKEARRYADLAILEKAGEIRNLRTQVRFLLIPEQRMGGKVVERECSYVADFVYDDIDGTIVEDTKGFRTLDYIIKRKLMLHVHGIRIREV